MSTDTETGVDAPPSPFPDPIVFAWLSFLEGLVAFGLTVFSIGLLEEIGRASCRERVCLYV